MADQPSVVPVYADKADPIIQAERAHLGLGQAPAFGLALSGGGIRSASFALGVLQALYGFGVFDKFHYFSTVSGGGYIGGALTYFRNAFTDLGADWFPFGYLRNRNSNTKVRAMAARLEAPDGEEPGNELARKIVAFLRQHASYMTPSRAFDRPALAAGVLRGLVSTLLPYLAMLSGVFGLLVSAGFFIGGRQTASGMYLAAWPTTIAVLILAFVLAVFLASSILAGFVHTIDRRETRAESGYRWLLWLYHRAGWLLLLALGLLAIATLPWVHDFLNSLWLAGGELPSSFAALFSAIAGAAGLVGKLRGVLGGEKSKPSPLNAIVMALAGILFIYGFLLLAYGASVDLLCAELSYKWPAISLAAGLVAAFFVNINHATQHRIYRDRLMEVFCAEEAALRSGEWSPAKRAQSDKGWLVNMTARRRPYHLINTCLVTTDSNKRRYRGRGGDNFILSPLFCGSDATGWAATETAMPTLSLATAIAVSGAALNAHTGPHGTGLLRNKAYAALLSLLGLNLGYWARNPKKFADGAKPRFHMPNLLKPGIAALAGRDLNEVGTYVQLSDGGHFENLAIYELIRRQVDFLWISDAGQDTEFSFEDLANAIERVRVDFGVNIRFQYDDFDLSHLIPGSTTSDNLAGKNFVERYRLATRGYAIGTIDYPDGKKGTVVYVKSTLTRHLPGDLYGYKARNEAFPHQTTLDQFFDEEQFEAYRELGYRLASRLFRDIEAARKQANTPSGATGAEALDRIAAALGI
jgi:hypothetical protein